MLTMYQQITIKTLNKQGKKNIEIAGELSCHRNTVRNILKRKVVLEKQVRSKPSCFSQYRDRIDAWLKTGITRVRIWEKLKDEYGINRPYITLCKYVERQFGKNTEAFVVQKTSPGEEAEVDFGYLGRLPAPDGERKKTWGFVMTLSYSRDAFYTTVTDQTIATFIKVHEEAFRYFGGVPQRVKLDNLKAAVIRNHRYDLELNRDFLAFAYHCGFVIVPCTPYEPQQKGKVESGVGYLKKNFLAGRTFTDYADLQKQLRDWRDYTANLRIHGTTKRIPRHVFLGEERQKLQPLPETPFVYQPAFSRLVKPNCHINMENSYYSVPFTLVGKTVEVRLAGELVRISEGSKEVAVHKRCRVPGSFITNESHYPEYKVYSKTTYQKKHEDKMRAIGPSALHLFQQVIQKDPKGWIKTVRNILGTAEIFGVEKTEKAIKRALYFGATQASIVRRICEKQLQGLPCEPPLLTALSQGNEQRITNDFLTRELSYWQADGISSGQAEKQTTVMSQNAQSFKEMNFRSSLETGDTRL